MATRTKLENFEATFNRKLTAAEAYANRPRFWMLYTVIVLIIVLLVGWSSADIHFTGLTVTGTEVAKGVLHGIFGPDTKLLFGFVHTEVNSGKCAGNLSRIKHLELFCGNVFFIKQICPYGVG